MPMGSNRSEMLLPPSSGTTAVFSEFTNEERKGTAPSCERTVLAAPIATTACASVIPTTEMSRYTG